MRVQLACVAVALASISGAQQQSFGPGPGEAYGFSTATGHGGSVTPYIFQSNIFANVPETMRVVSIDRVTVRNLVTSSGVGLNISLQNGWEHAILLAGMPNDANLNGTYTFVDNPLLPSIDETAASLGTSATVPGGTYRMTGGMLGFGDPGNMEDFSHFAGTRVWPGWDMYLLNYSMTNSGSVGGWEIAVTMAPVPEPCTVAVLAMGAVAVVRRRPKSR
jgi:hypothetical protein